MSLISRLSKKISDVINKTEKWIEIKLPEKFRKEEEKKQELSKEEKNKEEE